MKIDCLVLGQYQTNCYVLRQHQNDKKCVIIDTGLNIKELNDFLESNHMEPAAVVLTHGHADHIAGVGALRKSYPEIKTYIHKLDAELLTDPDYNLSSFPGISIHPDRPDKVVVENDIIDEAGIKLKVVHTPGHTPGGISLYCAKHNVLFTGDALFAGSIGRTDFQGGDTNTLITSVKQKLLTLPGHIVCYPGHGPETTITQEKKYNPFL